MVREKCYEEEPEDWQWISYTEQWHVGSLLVRQDWRRKGIGTRLMAMIVEIAALESLPVRLEATKKGRELYKKSGFKPLSRITADRSEERSMLMAWESK